LQPPDFTLLNFIWVQDTACKAAFQIALESDELFVRVPIVDKVHKSGMHKKT